MGYDLKCKFFYIDSKTKKPVLVSKGYVNQLKKLGNIRYSASLDNVNECYDFLDLEKNNEIYGYYTYEYVAKFPIVKFEVMDRLYDTKSFCEFSGFVYNDGYCFNDELFIETLKEKTKDYEIKGETISVYHKKYCNENGYLYDENSFITAQEYFNKKIEETFINIYKLKELQNTIEYFKLNDEQKEHIEETYLNYEEMMDEYKYQKSACDKMVNLLDYFKNDAVINDSVYRSEKLYVYISCS